MITSVVPILSERNPLAPFGRTGIDIAAEERFHGLVEALCLTIGLWMIGGRHAKLNASQREQVLPKLAGENVVTVRHYSGWHSMEAINLIEK